MRNVVDGRYSTMTARLSAVHRDPVRSHWMIPRHESDTTRSFIQSKVVAPKRDPRDMVKINVFMIPRTPEYRTISYGLIVRPWVTRFRVHTLV